MHQGVLIAEGKTKRIRQCGVDGVVEIESKNDITAGDGAKHDVLDGKAEAATSTTCHVFSRLERKGIPTHFLGQTSPTSFKAYEAAMIPIELVMRRVATGSYLERHPDAVEGEIFEKLIFEPFHKDDPEHDPLLRLDFEQHLAFRYPAKQPHGSPYIDSIGLDELRLGDDPMETAADLKNLSIQTFEILEAEWAKLGVWLIDLKIECGWVDGQLVVADVIDNDSWRIWPAGQKSLQLDKQVYRGLSEALDPATKAKELGRIQQNYAWVAEATGEFVR